MAKNEQTDGPTSESEQNPQPPEFSDRGVWDGNRGHYTNEDGQVCELQVRGADEKRVREYIEAVRVSFKVTPLNDESLEREYHQEEVDEKTRMYIEEGLKELEMHPELDLEIVIAIVETQGVELPYQLDALIDPPITAGATDNYRTSEVVHGINITLSATVGGVTGSLNGDLPRQADTYPPEDPSSSAFFSKGATSESQFSFAVTGLKESNEYSISTSATLVRV
jgi:hypothetical protein